MERPDTSPKLDDATQVAYENLEKVRELAIASEWHDINIELIEDVMNQLCGWCNSKMVLIGAKTRPDWPEEIYRQYIVTLDERDKLQEKIDQIESIIGD
jgi:hypothetical protein